jgi:hypothetical protein
MTEMDETRNIAMPSAEIAAREKALDLRLKELEIAKKEYEQKHRPSRVFSMATNPAVIAAVIAAWATLSAGLITWYSGRVSAIQQQDDARLKAEQEEINFETGAIVGVLNHVDEAHIATRLNLLVETGLITGDLAKKVDAYVRKQDAASPK